MSKLSYKQLFFGGVLALVMASILLLLFQTSDNAKQNLSWDSQDSAFSQLQQDPTPTGLDAYGEDVISGANNIVVEPQKSPEPETQEIVEPKTKTITPGFTASMPIDNGIVEPKTKVALNANGTGTTVSRSGQTDTRKYPKISKVNGSFGSFHYRELGGGRIEVDPVWIAENIVTINLPGLNKKVQVNRAAADNFIKAFTLIKNGTATINGRQVSLLSLIKTMDGTFVTRHVNWNSANGLSNHSWGTAIDINASNHFRYVNPTREPNDPNVILWEEAFKPAGFSWGNRYSDAMHYELLK